MCQYSLAADLTAVKDASRFSGNRALSGFHPREMSRHSLENIMNRRAALFAAFFALAQIPAPLPPNRNPLRRLPMAEPSFWSIITATP